MAVRGRLLSHAKYMEHAKARKVTIGSTRPSRVVRPLESGQSRDNLVLAACRLSLRAKFDFHGTRRVGLFQLDARRRRERAVY